MAIRPTENSGIPPSRRRAGADSGLPSDHSHPKSLTNFCIRSLGIPALVKMSAGLSSPKILCRSMSPRRTRCCTHRFCTARCHTLPRPCLLHISAAAVLSVQTLTGQDTPKSADNDLMPRVTAAAHVTPTISASPEDRAVLACVELHVLMM